jgi:hypothetical protein
LRAAIYGDRPIHVRFNGRYFGILKLKGRHPHLESPTLFVPSLHAGSKAKGRDTILSTSEAVHRQ